MKKYILRTFFSIVILSCLILILTKNLPNSLVAEMIISFQPYSLLISAITLVFLIPWITWKIVYQLRHKTNLKKIIRKNLLISTSVVLLLGNTLWMGVEVLGFYYPKSRIKNSDEGSIKLGFYNKYFTNSNLNQIDSELQKLDLDILGMGELFRSDIPYIKKLNEYKYSYTENCVCDFPQDVALFSKYPLLNSKTYAVFGARVIESTLDLNGEYINIFVVHTTAPQSKSKKEFHTRNDEFPELAKLINAKSKKSIVMGDFNVSPWSSHYKNFESDLNLENTARDFGIRFTWSSNFFKTHLDHIFVPKEWRVLESKTEGNMGSDHNLVWAKVNL